MDNRAKGEVSFELAGAVYVARFSMDALIRAEESLDMGIEEIFRSLEKKPRLKIIRALFYAALAENHPELNERLAGELFLQVGVGRVTSLLDAAAKSAFPDQAKGGGQDGDEIPTRRPAGGTGRRSVKAR